jgi:hypothetical protein
MDIYVIIKFKGWHSNIGNSWEVEGHSFVMEYAATNYVKDTHLLNYVKVNLNEEWQTKETDKMKIKEVEEIEIKSIAKKAFDKWRMETNG